MDSKQVVIVGLWFLLLSLICTPIIMMGFALAGSFSFVNPTFSWVSGGVTYISEPCSWNTLTLTPSLFDFTNFYWNPTAVTWSSFGFSCDSVGEYMNITSLTHNTVTIQPSVNNTSGRIWAGGMSHVISVSGASYTWDNVGKVVSFISDGSPDVVITFGLTVGGGNFGSEAMLFFGMIALILFLITRNMGKRG